MASLPEDVILSKLPVKSISRFSCVCQPWYEMFKTKNFIKMHLQHATQNNKFTVLLESYNKYDLLEPNNYYYTIDFDDVASLSYHMPVQTELPSGAYLHDQIHVVSCDGLIGLYTGKIVGDEVITICLWNPSTREFKKISTPPTSNINNKLSFSRFGVCYDWKIDDYKLFRIVGTQQHEDTVDTCSQVWVCRLGSSSWENVGDISYNIFHAKVSEKSSNGIIHWIQSTKVIVAFNVVELRTQEIQIPGCYLNNKWYWYRSMKVGVLGEDLYLLVNNPYNNNRNIDLWLMTDYGVRDSWIKIFSLSKEQISFKRLYPLHYLNTNGEILLHGVRVKGKDALVSYDPKIGRLVTLDIPGIPKHFDATTFVGSLVSLNSREFVKYSKISKVDLFWLAVERLKSGSFELQRPRRIIGYTVIVIVFFVYRVFWIVLLDRYWALGILGDRNLSLSLAMARELCIFFPLLLTYMTAILM